MEYTAYLMALIEVNDNGKAYIKFFTITSDKHPTCKLQAQTYAVIDRFRGESYSKAREKLVASIKQKVKYSNPNSLWHRIWSDIKES